MHKTKTIVLIHGNFVNNLTWTAWWYAVPESCKVSRQLVLNSYSNIDFSKPHAPILMIDGSSDTIFPPGLTTTIAKKYSDPQSKVDLKVFPGRSHFICGEKGWEQVSDYVLDWYEHL